MEKRSLLPTKVFEHSLDELEAAVVEARKMSDADTYRVSMLLKSGRSVTVVDYSSGRERKQAIADRINGFIGDNRK